VPLANYQVVVVVNDEGKPIGIKSVSDAAMINTAQRVDLLNDILP
jgi:translation initiation factor IF-3